MSFTKVPYDSAKVDALRIRLENHSRLGEPIFYSVIVDDLEVIPRTTDASLFATVDELLGPNTRFISVSEYIGNTRNRKTTCFSMDVHKSTEQTNLNGLDTPREDQQQAIERQVAHATLQRDHANLQTEYNKLKQVSEAILTKYDELEAENEELKKLNDEKSQQGTLLSFAADLVERFAPPKPDGSMSGTSKQTQTEHAEEGGDDGSVQVAISENEYKNYKYFLELFQGFDPTQKGLVSKLIELLGKNPDLIEELFATAYQKSKENGTEKD